MKTCSMCKKAKDESEFNKESRNKDGLCYYCKECSRKSSKESYESHRIKRLQTSKRWSENNKEKHLELQRKWYDKNKSEHLSRSRDNYLQNKDRKRKQGKEWIDKNKDRARIIWRRRRFLEKNASGYFSPEEWENLCESVGFKCVACGKVGDLTIDHIIPLSLGGTNDISNLQPLCRRCNSTKYNKIMSLESLRGMVNNT